MTRGHAAGKPELFVEAVIGGIVAVWAAVAILTKLRGLVRADRRGALIGGLSASR
jgi:hypothetical protein